MAKVVKKVVKKKKPESLFNPTEIEQASGGQGIGVKVTKASVFRDFLTNNPDATFGPSKEALAAALAEHGLELKDSDAVPFGVAKKKLGGGDGAGVRTARGGDQKGNGISLQKFADLTADIDPAMLSKSIDVISKVGGIDNAKALSHKWAQMCEELTEPVARKALKFM